MNETVLVILVIAIFDCFDWQISPLWLRAS
jgi:hypothetical protein